MRPHFFVGQPFFLFPGRHLRRHPFLDAPLPPGQGLSEPLHGHFPVLELRPALRRLGYNAGREMADSYSGIGDIPVLSPGAGATIKIDLQIGVLYLDCHSYLEESILLVDMKLCPYEYNRKIG